MLLEHRPDKGTQYCRQHCRQQQDDGNRYEDHQRVLAHPRRMNLASPYDGQLDAVEQAHQRAGYRYLPETRVAKV